MAGKYDPYPNCQFIPTACQMQPATLQEESYECHSSLLTSLSFPTKQDGYLGLFSSNSTSRLTLDPFYSSFKTGERRKGKFIMRFISFITAAVTISTAIALDAYFLCPYKTEGKCCLHVNLTSGTGSLCISSLPLRFQYSPSTLSK